MVVLGITTIISYGTTQYLFGVLVVPLDATFHWGRASISGAYTLGLIIAGLLGVPFGYLVDRRGARLLMSSGSALAGLALIGLARVNALWQFYWCLLPLAGLRDGRPFWTSGLRLHYPVDGPESPQLLSWGMNGRSLFGAWEVGLLHSAVDGAIP